jgi:hypothetical protein
LIIIAIHTSWKLKSFLLWFFELSIVICNIVHIYEENAIEDDFNRFMLISLYISDLINPFHCFYFSPTVIFNLNDIIILSTSNERKFLDIIIFVFFR